MTAGDFVVSTTPILIVPNPGWPTDHQLYNTGSNVIYIKSDGSAFGGQPINPSATKIWKGGTDQPLYAYTLSGTSTLNVIDNVGAITDPYAIAQQLNLVGVPAIERTTLIASGTVAATGGIANFTTLPSSTTYYDVSAYQSLFLLFMGRDTTASPRDYSRIFIDHFSSVNTQLYSDSCMGYGDNRSQLLSIPLDLSWMFIPSRSAKVQLRVAYTAAKNVDWSLYGSYRSSLNNSGILNSGYIPSFSSGTLTIEADPTAGFTRAVDTGLLAGAVDTIDVTTRIGEARYSVEVNGAIGAGGFDYFLLDAISGAPLYGARIVTAANEFYAQGNMIIPARPVQFYLRNRTAVALPATTITLTGMLN